MARRAATVGCLAGIVWASTWAFASASFTSPASAELPVASGSLSAPTGLTATNTGCVAGVITKVKLDWTASASTFADGYQISRSLVNGGPYTPIATVAGQATATYTDATTLFATTYYYVVKATKLLWTSPATSQVQITTLSTLCL